MDPLRQIRWFFPPFFFVASLALGARLEHQFYVYKLFAQPDTAKELIGLLAGENRGKRMVKV